MKRTIAWNDDGFPNDPQKPKLNLDLEPGNILFVNNNNIKPNKKISKTWLSYFKEFTANTSLHGLKYIGEEKRTIVEKIWWGMMFVLSVAACGHLIYKVWTKWQQSPVIVSFAESTTPVWQVPFPAITVCSETKSRQTAFNFTEYYHQYSLPDNNMTEEEKRDFQTVSLLCDNHMVTTGNSTTSAENLRFLPEVAPIFNETMWFCKWKTSIGDCEEHFKPFLTEDGHCYTFNMLSFDELFRKEELHDEYTYLENEKKSQGWTLEGGYPKHLSLETYPVRGTRAGTKAGLTLLLKAENVDLDFLCRGPVQGFKIILHNPSEIPRVSQQYFRLPFNQEVIAAVNPNMMTTSEGLRNYDPKRRQCFFPNERRLKYFKVYTQQNCEWECLSNYTMQACGCVSFAMPRSASMPICASGSAECMGKAEDDLLTKEITKGLKETGQAEDDEKLKEDLQQIAEHCNCMPACTTITYDAEISQADFNWRALFNAYKLPSENFTDLSVARAVIFFKESQFITHKRSELYGQTDFLANCGGLLGLFLGFSFLSFVEIVYFFSLRLFCIIKDDVSKEKKLKIAE